MRSIITKLTDGLEESKHQAQSRLSMLIDSMQMTFWEWDVATDKLRYEGGSQSWPEDIHNLATWLSHIHPDD